MNLVQKEFTGTESKSETEKLLRQAMEDYENKKFIAKADNITLGELFDIWAEEELKVSTLSNGTVENYLGAIRCVKKHLFVNYINFCMYIFSIAPHGAVLQSIISKPYFSYKFSWSLTICTLSNPIDFK